MKQDEKFVPGTPPGAEPPFNSDPVEWRKKRFREGMGIFLLVFGVLLFSRYILGVLIPFVGENLKAIAVIAFLYLPAWLIWRKGGNLSDYGLSLNNWRRDLKITAGLSAIVFPLFTALFIGFVWTLDYLPSSVSGILTPYSAGFSPAFRLPPEIIYMLAVHLLVVALPEEFFYRGWLYTRLCEGLDEKGRGIRIFGVVAGPAFWLTAALFAAGHLTEPYFWRLGVFFPALLFAWLRLRTGGLLAPIVFHALSNVFIAILEESFFP